MDFAIMENLFSGSLFTHNKGKLWNYGLGSQVLTALAAEGWSQLDWKLLIFTTKCSHLVTPSKFLFEISQSLKGNPCEDLRKTLGRWEDLRALRK